MTERTIGNVVNEIDEWKNRYGDFMYTVTAFFTDRELVSANKKDRDAALELRGLLQEVENVPQEFVLEQNGVSKAGNPKWKLVAFGPIDGPFTYSTLKDAPGVQGGGLNAGAPASGSRNRSPEQSDDIRRAVALKAAVRYAGGLYQGAFHKDVIEAAEVFDAWLSKTSEPALGAYEPVEGSPSPPQAGAGSEDRGEEVGGSTVDRLGEGTPASSPHEHDWQMRQGIRSHLVCDCGATRKREVPQATGQS